MNRTTMLKRILCTALALLMAFSAAASAELEQEIALASPSRFAGCETIDSLFEAAEAALKDGVDPAQVYDEMCSAAEEKKMLREFRYALENTAAYGSRQYENALAIVEKEGRKLDLGASPYQSAWDRIGFDPYGHFKCSDAFREMIADPGARYCLEQAVWTESEFTKVFGTAFSKFRAARPRAGYVCLVISDKSQSAPETRWDSTTLNYFRTAVQNMIRLTDNQEMQPVFTGNPDLASSFWVFEITYPFYAWYGSSGRRREVRGFNCNSSMTVYNAKNHASVAKLTDQSRLARTIYSWHDGIAEASVPYLNESTGFKSFVNKTVKDTEKQFETEDTSERILPVNAQNALNSLLKELAEESKDGWYRAICESGTRDVGYSSDSIDFSMRSFDPKAKELGAYAKAADGNAWLETALANASAYDLKLSLPMEDGRLTKQAKTSLAGALKRAATAAKTGLGGKDMASALSERFFPVPVEGKIKDPYELLEPSNAFKEWYASKGLADTGLSVEELAIICYAQKNQTLSAKTGPHQLELNCTGAEPADMIAESAKAVLDDMAYASASRISIDKADSLLREKLAAAAITARTKATSKYTITIDLDELAAGRNPEGYLETLKKFDTGETLEYIRATAANFPEEAAQAMPKAGKLQSWTSAKTGTRVTIDLYDGANPTYLLVLDAKDNSKFLSAFIMPGKKLQLQLPEGEYRFAVASGQWWYGEEALFSANGSYWISDATRIRDAKNPASFSLNPENRKELTFEKATIEDFR